MSSTFRDRFRDQHAMDSLRAEMPGWKYRAECLGLRERSGVGWYSDEMIQRCVEQGRREGTEVFTSRGDWENEQALLNAKLEGQSEKLPNSSRPPWPWHYFKGCDPSASVGKGSDDAMMVIMRARPKQLSVPYNPAEPLAGVSMLSPDWLKEFVWAFKSDKGLRAMTDRQRAGRIHLATELFRLDGICMDPNGGGYGTMLELRNRRQVIAGIERDARPITTPSDILPEALPILSLFKRGDAGIESIWPKLQGDECPVDQMHMAFQGELDHANVLFPEPWNDRPQEEQRRLEKEWSEERQWALKLISQGLEQLAHMSVATREDGSYQMSIRNAHIFTNAGKKDIAYAMIYAYVRFLIWLKNGSNFFGDRKKTHGRIHIIAHSR